MALNFIIKTFQQIFISEPVCPFACSLTKIQKTRHAYRDNGDSPYSNGRGSIPGRDWEFFSSPPHPNWLWGPPSLLSNWYRRFSTGSTAAARFQEVGGAL